MKIGDCFGAKEEREARQRHAERLRETYLEVGWTNGDAKRCAERDARWGLYLYAFGPEETERQGSIGG